MGSHRVGYLAQAMGDESVIIYVGQERKRYLVHKALLTNESNYFDRALNGSFKEAEDQAIDLPEETPAAVDLLVGWLYQDHIPVVGSAPGPFATPLDTATAVEKPNSGFTPPAFSFGAYQPPGLFGAPQRIPVQIEMQNTVFPQPNEGTGRVPYRPFTEPSQSYPPGMDPTTGPWNDTFQTIIAQPEYMGWSPEELRMVDYRAGLVDGTQPVIGQVAPTTINRPTPPSSPSSDKPFTSSQATFFGSSTRISGIPTCPSLDDLSIKEEEHQLAILQLCLLAETFCWDTLFNRAMTAYIAGEANLSHRPMRADHLELIYQRAHDSSPCRAFASDAVVFHLRDGNTHNQYLELTKEYPAFLEDIFKALTKNPGLPIKDPTTSSRCGYHNHPDGQLCTRRQGHKAPKKQGLWPAGTTSTSEAQHTRSWMEYRPPTHPGFFTGHTVEGRFTSHIDDDDDDDDGIF